MKIEIKPVRGVYFLLRKGELFYVGMSENVARRIEDHRAAKSFDRAYAISLPDAPKEELLELERALIRSFNPPGNKAGRNPVDWVQAPSPHLRLVHPEPNRLPDYPVLTTEQVRRAIGPGLVSLFERAMKDGSLPVKWEGPPRRSGRGMALGRRRLLKREDVVLWLKQISGEADVPRAVGDV